jgi:ParB family chromosome partitioning protein
VRKVLSEQGQESKNEENRNSVPIFQRLKLLKKIESALEELATLPESEEATRAEKSLYKALPTFLKTVQKNVEEVKQAVKSQSRS